MKVVITTTDYNISKAFDKAMEEAKRRIEEKDDYTFSVYDFKLRLAETSLKYSQFGERNCFEYEFEVIE